MLVVLDGLAGIDDGSIAGLELGIVVERLAIGVAFFDSGVNALEGFREASFKGGLVPSSVRDEGGELFVTRRFELGADLAEFGNVSLFFDPILFETCESGPGGEELSVFGTGSSVDLDLHRLEAGVGGLDVLFRLRDQFAELFMGDEGLRVVRVESGLQLVRFGDEVAVGRILGIEQLPARQGDDPRRPTLAL